MATPTPFFLFFFYFSFFSKAVRRFGRRFGNSLRIANCLLLLLQERFGMVKKGEWKRFAWTIGIVVLILAIGLAFFLFKLYPFEWSEKSVVFYSKDFPIQEGLKAFSENKVFLVATQFHESGTWNPYMANSLNLFSVALIGNQKTVTNLFMVVSPQTNELLSCQTNYGNPTKNEEITKEKCRELLDAFSGGKVLLFIPDSKLPKAQVLVKPNQLEVHPSNADNLRIATYSTLKKMFSNVDEIVSQVNNIAGQVGR